MGMVKPTGFQVWVDRYRLWCADLQPVKTHTQIPKPTDITIPINPQTKPIDTDTTIE